MNHFMKVKQYYKQRYRGDKLLLFYFLFNFQNNTSVPYENNYKITNVLKSYYSNFSVNYLPLPLRNNKDYFCIIFIYKSSTTAAISL